MGLRCKSYMRKGFLIYEEMCKYFTVNKLQSLNLLFYCMFRIEHKIAHVGTGKVLRLY